MMVRRLNAPYCKMKEDDWLNTLLRVSAASSAVKVLLIPSLKDLSIYF